MEAEQTQDFTARTIEKDFNTAFEIIENFYNKNSTVNGLKKCNQKYINFYNFFHVLYKQEKSKALQTLIESERNVDNSTRFSNSQLSLLLAQSYDANEECINDTKNQFLTSNVRKLFNQCVDTHYQTFLKTVVELRKTLESVLARCTKDEEEVNAVFLLTYFIIIN